MGGTSVVASVLLALLVARTVIVVEGLVDHNSIKKICSRVECPSYDVIVTNSLYQVRQYNSSVWISTDAFRTDFFTFATAIGMSKLNAYFKGNNDHNQVLKPAAPTLTKVLPTQIWPGLYTVSRYLPAENHPDPPPAEGLNVDKWGSSTFAVVKQVHDFVTDSIVAQEAASLKESLEGSVWAEVIKNAYSVALYEPFISSHIKTKYEIWITFESKDEESVKTF